MTVNQPISGWYPDPDGSGGQRHWDGERWTTHRRPSNAVWGTPRSQYFHRPSDAVQRAEHVWRGWSNNARLGAVAASVLTLVAVIIGVGATTGVSGSHGGPSAFAAHAQKIGVKVSADHVYHGDIAVVGDQLCTQLRNGTRGNILANIVLRGTNISPAGVQFSQLVTAAVDDLCPDAKEAWAEIDDAHR